MTKFKVGDKFIPRKPNNIWPFHGLWAERMERYWDRTMTIDEIHLISDDKINLVSECVSFNADWCEKVEETQSVETNEKVEEYIPETNKTIATGIDWEQRRYEIAKECLAAQINGVYAGNLEWSYDGEVKSAIYAADELIKQLQSS